MQIKLRVVECEDNAVQSPIALVPQHPEACRDTQRLHTKGGLKAEREWLRQSRLVLLLERTLEQHADSDGCVLLNVAGQLLRQHAPEDYAAMRMHYGFKSLKPLILAVGVFEIIEETTASGGTRISSGEGLPRRAVRLVFVTDGRIPAARSRQ